MPTAAWRCFTRRSKHKELFTLRRHSHSGSACQIARAFERDAALRRPGSRKPVPSPRHRKSRRPRGLHARKGASLCEQQPRATSNGGWDNNSSPAFSPKRQAKPDPTSLTDAGRRAWLSGVGLNERPNGDIHTPLRQHQGQRLLARLHPVAQPGEGRWRRRRRSRGKASRERPTAIDRCSRGRAEREARALAPASPLPAAVAPAQLGAAASRCTAPAAAQASRSSSRRARSSAQHGMARGARRGSYDAPESRRSHCTD